MQPEQQTLSSHGITLNLSSRKVLIGVEDAGITGKSFDVLHALMKHDMLSAMRIQGRWSSLSFLIILEL